MTTSITKIVTRIWSEILGVQKLAETSSFYELGGTSIEAELIASRIAETFGIEITGSDILRHERLGAIIGLVNAGVLAETARS